MEPSEIIASQIVSIAWIRCLQEEGVNFTNKQTGQVEKDERVIYDALENKTGLFDVPSAKASRWNLEKNILEVFGSYCLYNDDPYLLSVLFSSDLKTSIKDKIGKIKEGLA